MQSRVKLSKYIWIFIGWYIGLNIVLIALHSFFDAGSSAMSVVLPFLAAMAAGESFLKGENRIPSQIERKKLTNRSFSIVMIIQLFLTLLVVISGALSELQSAGLGTNILVFVGIFILIAAVIQYFLIRWAYGGITRRRAARLGIRDEDDVSTFN